VKRGSIDRAWENIKGSKRFQRNMEETNKRIKGTAGKKSREELVFLAHDEGCLQFSQLVASRCASPSSEEIIGGRNCGGGRVIKDKPRIVFFMFSKIFDTHDIL
jgi:hypothetical protein